MQGPAAVAEPLLSFVVPATDDPPTLAAAVAAIEPGLRAGDELIVQREPERGGPALARNLGAERASGEVLVFVDADVVVAPDAIARIRSAFTGPRAADAVFGAYDANPADPGVVSRYRNLLHHHVHASSAGPADTFWAGLGAVRRDRFAAVGGFDALRFRSPSVEDVELGMRLRESGAAILLDPAIRGRHLKRWTLRSMLSTDHSRRARPWARLLLEAGTGAPRSLNLTLDRRLSAAFSVLCVGALTVRRPLAAAAALAAVAGLNRGLLRLLARRGGPGLAAAGLVLQIAHELSAVTAVPAALIQHKLDPGRGPLS
ncbi:MAG TPA: glycosyltransferase [Solirubrobacterales bacterium]|nr:glycosyltransferase [Solirubrobacterales bacterium]